MLCDNSLASAYTNIGQILTESSACTTNVAIHSSIPYHNSSSHGAQHSMQTHRYNVVYCKRTFIALTGTLTITLIIYPDLHCYLCVCVWMGVHVRVLLNYYYSMLNIDVCGCTNRRTISSILFALFVSFASYC